MGRGVDLKVIFWVHNVLMSAMFLGQYFIGFTIRTSIF